jgi:hypothetical protein
MHLNCIQQDMINLEKTTIVTSIKVHCSEQLSFSPFSLPSIVMPTFYLPTNRSSPNSYLLFIDLDLLLIDVGLVLT